MTDIPMTAPDSGPSTELQPNASTSNPASYKPDAEPEKKEEPKLSARQALEKAQADLTGKAEAKPEGEKPKAEIKADADKTEAKPQRERADDGKFRSNEPSEPNSEEAGKEEKIGGNEVRSSEGRDTKSPPPNFLPRAKERWGTVDPSVQEEVYRALDNFEKGKAEYEEDRNFRKGMREFERMATEAGTTVPDALRNYTNIDRQLREDPAAGVARILQSIGLTPQQYAQFVLGQAQQQQQNPQFAEQQRLQSQIQQLTQTVQQLTHGNQQDREQARVAEVERSIIEPFRSAHPRYGELEADIAFFLTSGKIPSTLNEQKRLEVAYDMAERINPAPYAETERVNTAPQGRTVNPAGQKSIKGSPGSADTQRGPGKVSTRDAIKAAAAQHGINI